MAEKYQEETSSSREQEQQNEYLRIIDDLSSELNTLSRQVNMVQRDFPTDEVAKQFESSLRALETQNDLLQSAVESLIQERETIERTLQTQNEELKERLCEREAELNNLQEQLLQVQRRPCEACGHRARSKSAPRSSRLEETRLDSMEELRRRSELVERLKDENNRLMEELKETKRSQAKMKLLQRRGVMSAAAEENANNHDQLLSRLSAAEDQNTEKTRSLQKAHKEISYLQQQIKDLSMASDAFTAEREILQLEIDTLKETKATQRGKLNSLEEQLQGTMNELHAAKDKLKEIAQLKDHIDARYQDEVKRFNKLKEDMFQKYNNLVEEYNQLNKEYQKVVQIEREKSNQIRALNVWKEAQIESDRKVCRKMQMYESHFKELLEDKLNLLDRLNETENDNRTLLQVIERTSRSQKGDQSASSCSPSGYHATATENSTHPVSRIIESSRSAARRLSQQNRVLQDEARHLFPQGK